MFLQSEDSQETAEYHRTNHVRPMFLQCGNNRQQLNTNKPTTQAYVPALGNSQATAEYLRTNLVDQSSCIVETARQQLNTYKLPTHVPVL